MDDKMKEALRQANEAKVTNLEQATGEPDSRQPKVSLDHLNNAIDTNELGKKALEQSREERGITQDQDR